MINAVVNAAGTWMWNNRTHGELKWTTIETEHFNIHYHQNLDKIALQGASIAEQISSSHFSLAMSSSLVGISMP